MELSIDRIGSNIGTNCVWTKEVIALSTAFWIASSVVDGIPKGPMPSANEVDPTSIGSHDYQGNLVKQNYTLLS
jgi:hypothetical protein